MKKDAIWLVSGGPMQKIAASRIRRRGFALILSDGSPTAFCREMADLFLCLDTFDVEGHIGASGKVVDEFNIAGVMTTAADCHYTVNRLARHLGLPHLNPSISEACRNKILTRRLLTQAGLDQPEFFVANSFEEATNFLRGAAVDYVIKSTDNSGSRGFSTLPKGRPLTEEQFESALRMGTTRRVLIEERLRPDERQVSEASVETLWQDGKMYWINWVDRIFSADLRFFPQLKVNGIPKDSIEIGHLNPARRSRELKDRVWADLRRAGIALGMDEAPGAHILKADIYFSDRGPVILELTPRTSGGWDSSGTSLARGAEIADGVIHMCMGQSINLEAWHRYFQFKYPEITAVAVSRIPEGAKDCIGREFALASGSETAEALFLKSLDKLNKGEFHVPIL